MHCRPLPFRCLPHQPKLSLDLLYDYSRVSRFYPLPPSLESVTRAANSLDYPSDRRQSVANILREQNAAFGAGKETERNLARFENAAVAILTGQQVGLFTGPAYAIYKALSAIKVAKEVTEAGIDAVPLFWMATEDHDLDEVRHTTFFQDGELAHFELPPAPSHGAPVGSIRLGESISELVRAATVMLPGAEGAALAKLLREFYRPEESYAGAFGKLFAQIFADYGLILIDPLDARVHRIASPVYVKAIENREALNAELLNRDNELEREGYAAQVKVTARSALLFFTGGGVRQPITANDKKFRSGEMSWGRDELLARIKAEPEKFSANALLRPVVQDYLFPTVACVVGPAEVSYFAQSEVLYRGILGRMPALLPRAGFTIVDPKGQRLLEEYGLQVEDVWKGPQWVRRHIHSANLPKPIAKQFEKDAKQIDKVLDKWASTLTKVDPTLLPAVETTKKKVAFQVDKLRQKAGHAFDRKTGVLAAHEDFLNNLLYPRKALQSRDLNFLPFLARWGFSGLRDLENHTSIKSLGQHFIVPIP
ncbi:MAG TPA: bacillithiol biosynthesis cysteine-adding enzyme BshC [Candidatus Acidoferrum sp.]|nr:bacillithiol biosynthesis cysteine-adding enzyme BshC [Candidatus Acidoferrum sp.]